MTQKAFTTDGSLSHRLPWQHPLLLEENKDAPPAGGAAPQPKADAGASELAALQKRVAEFEAAEQKRVADQKKADEEAQKKAAADGDLKKQFELQSKRVAELEALQADAELGKVYRERETKRIAEAIAKLSESDRALVEQAPNLQMKAALVDRLAAADGKTTSTEAKKSTTKGGAPASDGINFAEAIKDPATWAKAKHDDPDGAAAFMDGLFTDAGKRRDPLGGLRRPITNGHGKQ